MATSTFAKRRARRSRQRGAAMVEGIVIMTTMLVFLGMNVFAVKAYGGKIDQANSTRRDALYFATHNCEERNSSDPDTYTDHGALAGNDARDGASSLSLMGIIRMVRGQGGFDILATGRSSKTGTVGATAVVNTTPDQGITMGKRSLSANVKTTSAVGCNEKPYYDPWYLTIFEKSVDFLTGFVTG